MGFLDKRIALVTCSVMSNYSSNVESEDDKVINYFRAQGVNIKFEIWNDESVNWNGYDALLIKSPWDYFDLPEAFNKWLDNIKASGIPMYNSVDTIRWNADKLYLDDIKNAGFDVVPTLWLNKGSKFEADKLYKDVASDKLIFKPRISGGSKNTFKIPQSEAAGFTEKLNTLLETEDFMIQPFISEIETKGEWSLIFFNGKFSHSVLKTAKTGDFRVQHYLGGTIHATKAPDYMIDNGQKIVNEFANDCLYARVDGIEADGKFLLMELELIEPFLFLFTDKEAISRYFEAFKIKL